MAEYNLPLKKRETIAESTMAFWLDISKTGFKFRAGQHTRLTLIEPPFSDDEGDSRTFSIASAPNKEDIMIATGMRNTAFKNSLKEIPLRTEIKAETPLGQLTLPNDTNTQLVFLAGGIGITPFRSMIEFATKNKLNNQISLFYVNKTPSAAAFLKDLEEFARLNKNFRLFPFVTDYRGDGWEYGLGRYTFSDIKANVKNLDKSIFYIAGSPDFVVTTKQMLLDSRIRGSNIHIENFVGY